MTTETLVNITLCAATAINLMAYLLSMSSRRTYKRAKAEYDQALDEVRRFGRNIHREIVARLGLDLDLCERVLNDLKFMHEHLLYSQAGNGSVVLHACPTCDKTIPDMERVIQDLQEAQAYARAKTTERN